MVSYLIKTLYREENSEINKSCNTHLYYSSLVWAQNSNSIKILFVLQKKFLRVIYFLNHNAHTSHLFRDLSILKLPNKIALENCLFANKYFNKCLPTIFKIGLLSNLTFIPTIPVGLI